MNKFYSPFKDRFGEPKRINRITYRDIKKLINSNMSEGFYHDYKSSFDFKDKTKKFHQDLCEDICSFANNEGGWLIYGIEEDNSHKLIDKPIKEQDYFKDIQPISEIIKSNCKPLPNFETCFIKNPTTRDRGYFIIYVYEGLFPPYIANGKIKTRIGSSGSSVSIQTRAELDFLYYKNDKYEKLFNTFCDNGFIYPGSNLTSSNGSPQINICVYSNKCDMMNSFSDIEEIINEIKKIDKSITCQVQANSIMLIKDKRDFSKNTKSQNIIVPLIGEIFFDYSFKLYIPLVLPHTNNIERIMRNTASNLRYENYKFFDGFLSHTIISVFLDIYSKILKYKNIKPINYMYTTKYLNTENVIMIVDEDRFYQHVRECGFRWCLYNNQTSDKYDFLTIFNSEINNESETKWIDISMWSVFTAFGYLPQDLQIFTMGERVDEEK